jgi:hypothetical protein
MHDDGMRARRTAAMLCQLPAEDTLVPPNLRTTQPWLCSKTDVETFMSGEGEYAPPKQSIVFEDFFQFFFELPLGEHVLDAAPRSLATLFSGSRRFGPTLGAFYQRIEVMGFFGFA